MTGKRFYRNDAARIWSYVSRAGIGCWGWAGHHDEKGYGRVLLDGRSRRAYRAVWELEHGPVPPGLELDHLCRNRGCVNPDHLEPVDHRTNTLRGQGPTAVNATKDACKYGHPFNEENTIRRPDRPNTRTCRACKRRDSNKARDRRVSARIA